MMTIAPLPALGGHHVDHPLSALLCGALAVAFMVGFTSLAMSANASGRPAAERPRWTRGMTIALLGAVLSCGAVLAL